VLRVIPLINIRPDPKAIIKVFVRGLRAHEQFIPSSYARFPLHEQEFVIDRELFCRRSEFLKDGLKEAEDSASDPDNPKPIVIENHDPADFDKYLRSIDTGELDTPVDGNDLRSFMLRLYVLTNHLRDLAMANGAITHFMQLSDQLNQLPTEREISYVWEAVPVYRDKMRQLFVDYQIHEAPRESLVFDTDDTVPFEYLVDVALEFSDLATQRGNHGRVGRNDDILKVKCLKKDWCYYHQHEGFHSFCHTRRST